MKMPKLFIFDMDGLIFDSERVFMHKLGEVMKEYGYELSEEFYVTLLGLCGDNLKKAMSDKYGEDYPCEEISTNARNNTILYVKDGKLAIKEGIIPLLEFISSKNIPCAVASSTPTKHVKMYLETAGIDKFFSFVIGGECVAVSKPNPDIFQKTCREAGVDPTEAIVLEDSENGILAAYRAKIPVVCIPDMKYPSDEHVKMTAHVLEKADMLIDILEV